MTYIIGSAHMVAGSQFVLESLADRGDMCRPDLFLHAEHSPLWLMPNTKALLDRNRAQLITLAQYMFRV